MRILLEDGSYQVAEESLGREAIRRIEAEAFDLVVCDIHLQDISGLDVCRAIRQGPRGNIPILMVSAVARGTNVEQEAVSAGATQFVVDSADAEAFLTAVRQTLG